MLNFRKLKHEYSSSLLREGRELNDKGMLHSAKILGLSANAVRLGCCVVGAFDNTYHCEVEIDLSDSTAVDTDCDCLHKFDCQHLVAFLFYLEEHYNEMVVAYSKETDIERSDAIDEEEKETLRETFKEAQTKEVLRQDKKYQKELLQEYIGAAKALGQSPFFLPEELLKEDSAELALIFNDTAGSGGDKNNPLEIQLALRLPYRSKPLYVLNIREFLNAVRYGEFIYIGNKRFFFTLDSFDPHSRLLVKLILDYARFPEVKGEKSTDRSLRIAHIEPEAFGTLLAQMYSTLHQQVSKSLSSFESTEVQEPTFPCLYRSTLEEPLRFAKAPAVIRLELEYLEAPAPKLLIKPTILLDKETAISFEEARLFECAEPGLIYEDTYYCFQPLIKRKHLRNIEVLRSITIPEHLFGTFVENSLPELMRYAEVSNKEAIDCFVTLPFVGDLKAECDISYLNGELEAVLHFVYDKVKVPAAATNLKIQDIAPFVTPEGILARNLTEEQKIIDDLFQDFLFDPSQGSFTAKNDKKIVEFMTEVIPQNQDRVTFHCPENLLDQFIYDDSHFILNMRESSRIDAYTVELKVNGHLKGVSVDLLWECISSKRSFIELVRKKPSRRKGGIDTEMPMLQKILVIDLEKLRPVVQIFDEIGITLLSDHDEERPLWSLASIDDEQFEGLPIKFSMSKKLKEIQDQMLGRLPFDPAPVPQEIRAKLRDYQSEGVMWLERLRHMHLNGILADDMGLGKTLQAIIAVTQHKLHNPQAHALIVCPTSLLYNWKEEFTKFNPQLKVLPVDGTPAQRKKLLEEIKDYDVVITSYSLLQKDTELYQATHFSYMILDEAQHIKNRSTRNAKSVKQIRASHRLILTGTPIENSLDELWSLFDFLMPGLLSTYDRFVDKYVRNPQQNGVNHIETLRRKVSPFILRRMKKDVVAELPPITEIIYHCHLSDTQRDLYRSYAASAREELSQLVQKEGFDRVQIHVLATLTRLKQICCHPAIFAKETAERGDSAKYDMLMELMRSLIEGGHKTVIFSQYTRMLHILREDFRQQGISFEYLDGSSKNRLSIVKRFNEDKNILVFLVSLKAGGEGLNLVGADTVIHYDMWWNPAVENQATDRVHRLGQTSSVSSYKLVTLNTIEEKITELQNRKRGLVKKIITSEEEAISKLTWEEVLELLQT